MKRKRISYTAAFKLKVIQFAEAHNNSAAAREFEVPESNVRLWKQQKEDLTEMPKSKKARRGKQAEHPDLEKDLTDWVHTQRQNGQIITCLQLRLQARRLAADQKYGIPKGNFMHGHQIYEETFPGNQAKV